MIAAADAMVVKSLKVIVRSQVIGTDVEKTSSRSSRSVNGPRCQPEKHTACQVPSRHYFLLLQNNDRPQIHSSHRRFCIGARTKGSSVLLSSTRQRATSIRLAWTVIESFTPVILESCVANQCDSFGVVEQKQLVSSDVVRPLGLQAIALVSCSVDSLHLLSVMFDENNRIFRELSPD